MFAYLNKMEKFNLLIICGLGITIISSIETAEIPQQRFRVCGSALEEAVSSVCLIFNRKRSDPYFPDVNDIRGGSNLDDETNLPDYLKYVKNFKNYEMERGLHSKFGLSILKPRRYKRDSDGVISGIVEECCFKECSYSELTGYCAR